MIDPIWKEHIFKVMEQAPEAKCVSLLSQVMDEFKDVLSPGEQEAIADWFGKNYRMPPIRILEPQFLEGSGKAVNIRPEDLLNKY